MVHKCIVPKTGKIGVSANQGRSPFDKYGNASAEMASVFDTVAKYIKDLNRPNGGMLVIGTMDNLQIDPQVGFP